MVSQLEPCGTNWIKTKEKFASREKIRKWKSGFKRRFLDDCRLSKVYIDLKSLTKFAHKTTQMEHKLNV
jgi:hypothetical protein